MLSIQSELELVHLHMCEAGRDKILLYKVKSEGKYKCMTFFSSLYLYWDNMWKLFLSNDALYIGNLEEKSITLLSES